MPQISVDPKGAVLPLPPVVALVAMTDEARAALAGRSEVRMNAFPCTVGRESRSKPRADSVLPELRLGRAPQVNIVYLMERSWADTLQISREHFAIEYAGSQFFLVDRGSACGTIVAGTHVGGERTGGRTELRSGDEIIVGTGTSPYLFRFETVSDGQRYPAC
jgi:pSer/pThr/pTyr-binding forkhead associated (FHA) protein